MWNKIKNILKKQLSKNTLRNSLTEEERVQAVSRAMEEFKKITTPTGNYRIHKALSNKIRATDGREITFQDLIDRIERLEKKLKIK